jgi:hypothetical protein
MSRFLVTGVVELLCHFSNGSFADKIYIRTETNVQVFWSKDVLVTFVEDGSSYENNYKQWEMLRTLQKYTKIRKIIYSMISDLGGGGVLNCKCLRADVEEQVHLITGDN